MKKIITHSIVSIILLLMILIPFATCYDYNGDGVDDGQQNLCGDNFCQTWETKSSCPADCENPNNTSPTRIVSEKSLFQNDFFSSIVFKIIIILAVLIIIGIIIYIIIKRKNQEINERH